MSLQEAPEAPATLSFVCERCRGLTLLASIEPHPTHGERIEVHTFECMECGHRDSFNRDAPRCSTA